MQRSDRDKRGRPQWPARPGLMPLVGGGAGGPLVVLLVLLAALCHRPAPPGRAAVAGAARPQFCGLQTIRLEVEQSFREGETGVKRLRCRGNITLTSCEGQCRSSVAPSVISTAGFVKKCSCCKETMMQSTKIQLAHCVTDEGACISDYKREVVIQEPSSCACQPCSP